MALSTRQKTAIGVVSGYLLVAAADPFVTLFRLNVEEWAKEKGYDQLDKLLANPPEWLIAGWEFLIGPFGLGFALGALLFGVADYRKWLFPRRRAKNELIELRAEGVKHRNQLRLRLTYDHAAWRTKRGDWSDRVVAQLHKAGASPADISHFKALDEWLDTAPDRADPRNPAQIGMDKSYSEQLRRLEKIMAKL